LINNAKASDDRFLIVYITYRKYSNSSNVNSMPCIYPMAALAFFSSLLLSFTTSPVLIKASPRIAISSYTMSCVSTSPVLCFEVISAVSAFFALRILTSKTNRSVTYAARTAGNAFEVISSQRPRMAIFLSY